jgi:hypothetical protein
MSEQILNLQTDIQLTSLELQKYDHDVAFGQRHLWQNPRARVFSSAVAEHAKQ